MASEEIESTKQLLFSVRQTAAISGLTALRQGYEALVASYLPDPSIEITVEAFDDLEVAVLSRKDGELPGTILYLHGGGYCIGSIKTHLELCSRLAKMTGFRVVLPDYPLAPEHPYPDALNKVFSFYTNLVKSSQAPVAVAGDSAGGGLSLALGLKIKDNALENPIAFVLLSPWVDLTLENEYLKIKAEADPVVSVESLDQMRRYYLGDLALIKDPYVSPLFGDFSGFSPVLIQAGSDEVLIGDAKGMRGVLDGFGVRVVYEEYEGCFHVFQQIAATSEEAEKAVSRIGVFLNEALK